MRAWVIIGLLLGQVAAVGQTMGNPQEEGGPARRDRMHELQQKAGRLIQVTRLLGDWDEHYEYMLDATERVFERNGWDSESDLFSLEVFREVAAVPPWAMQERYDTLMEMVGDRYLLDEGQTASLQNHIMRHSVEIFSRHSDRIMQYASEAIETRAAGEPFTPEQVARWVRLAEPVFQDARRSMNATSREFLEELDPEQRELAERDLEAANRRMRDVDRMSQRWKRGEWDPHDWGMEEDPIQMQGMPGPDAAAGEAAAGPERRAARGGAESADMDEPPPRERERLVKQPQDEHPWAQYVRAFIRKYDLNHEQQQRAWLLYRDTRERDEVFDRRHERQMERVRARAGMADSERTRAALRGQMDKHRSERERLFELLKRRLERLPTRAQRKSAEPEDADRSDSAVKDDKAREKP